MHIQYGQWTILGQASPGRITTHVNCVYSCGNIKDVGAASLLTGRSTKCVACKMESLLGAPIRAKAKDTWHRKFGSHRAAFNEIFGNYKRNAKNKGLEFNLALEDFKRLTLQNCFYCNSVPINVMRRQVGDLKYNGIDRQDNVLGYTLGNCVPCCCVCNKAKLTMSATEFKSWIIRVHGHWANKEAS